VRPERFELPAFWFVARRSIQLSYGRISFLDASQQLTAGSAYSSTATFGASDKNKEKPRVLRPGLQHSCDRWRVVVGLARSSIRLEFPVSLFSFPQERSESGKEAS
jgi:uncharacterized protein (UPF0548 family)